MPDHFSRVKGWDFLVNLGTPDGTDFWSVRRYLREFLSDRRVVETPPPHLVADSQDLDHPVDTAWQARQGL